MADSTYQPKAYHREGGNHLVVARGGRFIPDLALTDVTTAGAATYTKEAIAGGVITRDPAGAARTDTTPTAADIISECGLQQDGETALCYLINTADAAEAITLAGGTGVTISNAGQTLAQNESAVLLFRRTGAAAVTLYILGA